MVTEVIKNYAAAYADLYSTVSDILRTHDSDGNKVPYGDQNALLSVTPISLDEETYQQDRYYTIETGYELCTDEEYDASKTYFENIPNTDGTGFEKVEANIEDADDYQSGKYYVEVEKFVLCSDETVDPLKDYYESDTITSLDELFSYMADIAKLEPRYTRLPLQEPCFEINPDTREITVPKQFSQNGISVQGDEIAETLYFKVPRYYDATDLYEQDILIQWKCGTSADAPSGVSKPWIVDAQSEPGYLIFGWPISSRITKTAGTVTFSVRFYTYDPDEEAGRRIRYSLSTLNVTTTSIKPGLNFDIETILYDDKGALDYDTNLIAGRFVNSSLIDGTTEAVAPEFILSLMSQTLDPYTFEGADSNCRVLNLGKDANGFTTNPVAIKVQAINTDGGQITYNWKKWDLDGYVKTGELAPSIDYVVTKDTTRQSGKIYYTLAADGKATIYTGALTAAGGEELPEIYEKVSYIVVDSTGRYTVYANNRLRNNTKSAQDPAKVIVVPAPVAPVIVEADKMPATLVLTKEGNYLGALTDKHTAQEADGKLTYKWYKSVDNTTFAAIEGETGKTLNIKGTKTIEGEEEGTTEEVIDIDENNISLGDGYYKVEVTDKLNNKKAAVTSNVCRVTHEATKPSLTCYSKTAQQTVFVEGDYQTAIGATLKVVTDLTALVTAGESHRTNVDTITYKWYLYNESTGDWDRDKAKATEGKYAVNGDIEIPDATEETYVPTDAGYYFCEVTNTYNGNTASACSPFFSVQRI